MSLPFQLAACAEMIWRDRPIEWRASRLKEMGFGVGLWNWPEHDLAKLEATGATFTIMNGYLAGRLTDDEGAAELLKTARETSKVGKRLGVLPADYQPNYTNGFLTWPLEAESADPTGDQKKMASHQATIAELGGCRRCGEIPAQVTASA